MSEQTPSTEDVQSAATQCPDGITPAEWDAWLTTHDRAVKAEAWAEGHDAGWIDAWAETHEQHSNPYRIEADHG